MENNKSKALKAFLIQSQNKKVESLKDRVKENHNMAFFKTNIVQIAISELLENTSNDNDLETLLEKYNYI